MNPALLIVARLLTGQANGDAADPALQGEHVETDAEAVKRLEERVVQLEQRMAELREQKTARAEDVEALQERAATLEEQVQAPAEAAETQNAGRAFRLETAQRALVAVRDVATILESGDDDVAQPLGQAITAFTAAQQESERTGSAAEAQRFADAIAALQNVPAMIAQRDFGRAKEWNYRAAVSGSDGLSLAFRQTLALVP